MSRVNIRDAASADELKILEVADRQLGVGYIDGAALGSLRNGQGFSLVAEAAGRVVGFTLCLRQDVPAAEAMMKCQPPKYMQDAETAGAIKTVAVDGDFQGRSVGSALVEASVHRFQSEGISGVYTVAWKSATGTNIGGIIRRLGFTEVAEVPGYWRHESLTEGFSCPACPEPPCGCSAVIAGLLLPSGTPASGQPCRR